MRSRSAESGTIWMDVREDDASGGSDRGATVQVAGWDDRTDARLDDRLEDRTEMVDIHVVDVDVEPGHPPWRPVVAIVASLAALALVIGMVIADDRGDDPADVDDPAPLDEPAAPPDAPDPGSLGPPAVAGVPEAVPEPRPGPPEPAVALAPLVPPDDAGSAALPGPLPFPKTEIEPGTYTTALLGVPMAIALPDVWRLERAVTGTVHLVDPRTGSRETGRSPEGRELLLRRIGGWSDATEAADPFGGPGTIGPHDIESWAAADDLVVEDRGVTTIAGRPTQVFDVVVDPTSEVGHGVCVPEERPCLFAASVSAESERSNVPRRHHLAHGRVHRFWLVEVGELDPILIRAATTVDDADWLDEVAATTIPFIGLGPDTPPRPAG